MAGQWSEQFSSGDQGQLKVQFWRNDYKICPACQGGSISEDQRVAGCRHNGDGYGTTVFMCNRCSWSTSFQYDEADGGPYFYETRTFSITPPTEEELKVAAEKAERFRTRPLGTYIRSRYAALRVYQSDEACVAMMQRDGYCDEVIAEFLRSKKKLIPFVPPDAIPSTITQKPIDSNQSESKFCCVQ